MGPVPPERVLAPRRRARVNVKEDHHEEEDDDSRHEEASARPGRGSLRIHAFIYKACNYAKEESGD